MEPLVRFERHGGVAVLTLNRADKRNALNLALWGELEAHIAAIEALGDAIGAVVLRAAGPVFCAGNDLKERGIATPRPNYQASIVTRLASLPQPVIVAVQGGCFTGGLELALAGDIILAGESASFADTHREAHRGRADLVRVLRDDPALAPAGVRALRITGRRILDQPEGLPFVVAQIELTVSITETTTPLPLT